MRTLLANKEKHYKNYANAVAKLYKQLRYGIDSCRPTSELDLSTIRKELVDWQANEDGGALSDTNIQYRTWLGLDYDDVYLSRGGAGYYNSSRTNSGERIGLNYNYNDGNSSQNIIEVNTGGCVTRINLNPAIVINNNSSFEFKQSTVSTIWNISHNLALKPNVRIEDLQGNDIQGVIEYIDNNNIRITFNQPVAGRAYLS